MILRPGELLGIPAAIPDVPATVATLRWGLWLVAALWAVMVAGRGRRAWLLGGLLFVWAASGYWLLALGRPYGLLVDGDITRGLAVASVAAETGQDQGVLAGETARSQPASTLVRAQRVAVLWGPSLLPLVVVPGIGILLYALWGCRSRAPLAALLWLAFSTGDLDTVRGVGLVPSVFSHPWPAAALLPAVALVLLEARWGRAVSVARTALGVAVVMGLGCLVPAAPIPRGLPEALLTVSVDQGLWLPLALWGLSRTTDAAAWRLTIGGGLLTLATALPLPIDPVGAHALYRLGLLLAASEPVERVLVGLGEMLTPRLPRSWPRIEAGRLGTAALLLTLVPSSFLAWWHPLELDPVAAESRRPIPMPLREAMEWIRRQTPRTAVFIASAGFAPAVAALGGRQVLRAPGLVEAANDARRRVVEEKVLKGKQPERALVRFGVTHVFIAPGDFTEYGVKAPEALEAYPQFRLRYCNDEGYRVYELLP